MVVLGHVLTGIGVGIFLYAALGVDPVSVFVDGFAKQIGASYGTASMIYNAAVLLIVLFIDRRYVNIASVLAVFLIGYSADAATALLGLIKIKLPLVVNLLLILIGCAVMSIGIAAYTSAKLGVGAGDSMSQLISDKTRLAYRWVRIGCDVLYVVVGWLLGGTVGVGTIVGAFLTGPMVQFFRPATEKVTSRMMNGFAANP